MLDPTLPRRVAELERIVADLSHLLNITPAPPIWIDEQRGVGMTIGVSSSSDAPFPANVSNPTNNGAGLYVWDWYELTTDPTTGALITLVGGRSGSVTNGPFAYDLNNVTSGSAQNVMLYVLGYLNGVPEYGMQYLSSGGGAGSITTDAGSATGPNYTFTGGADVSGGTYVIQTSASGSTVVFQTREADATHSGIMTTGDQQFSANNGSGAKNLVDGSLWESSLGICEVSIGCPTGNGSAGANLPASTGYTFYARIGAKSYDCWTGIRLTDWNTNRRAFFSFFDDSIDTNGIGGYALTRYNGAVTVTASFTIPAVTSTVTVSVADTSYMTKGDVIFFYDGVHAFTSHITAIGGPTSVTVENDIVEMGSVGDTFSSGISVGFCYTDFLGLTMTNALGDEFRGGILYELGTKLSIASGKTLTVSNTLTLTGTDGSSVAFGAGGTVLYSSAIGSTVQAHDSTLDSLASYNTNGLLTQTAADTFTGRTLTGPAAGITVTNGNGVSGNPTLALANDLSALEGLSSTGFAVRTTTDTWAQRSLTAPAAGITISNNDGVSGNPTFALANDLAALEALAGTNTIYYRSGSDTWTNVTIGSNLSFSGGTLDTLVALNVTDSGVYTPTLTNTTNVSSSTAFQCQYERVGKTVTVSGRLTVTFTTTGSAVILGISLPIASNFGAKEDCCGTGYAMDVIRTGGLAITGDATNDRAQIDCLAPNQASTNFTFHFTYRII